jgi:Cof subfamily protein (haloacid dehalogenase superfamily)
MEVRLVAIDIDGTLLDSRGRIPDDNVAAIVEALEAGIHVALVTGRSFPFARAVSEALPRRVSLIVSNGAVERAMDGTRLACRLLPREDARAVLQHTRAFREHSAVIFDRDAEGHVVAETMDWEHPHRRGYWRNHRHCIAHARPLEDALQEDPVQVMFNGDVATMRAVFETLRGFPGVSVCRTEYERRDFALVDVTAPTATKAHALRWRLARLGLEPGQLLAIGDNLNDVEMLEIAGVPVIMGNAVPALKERGWRETASHDDAGVAQAIRRFALNGAGA